MSWAWTANKHEWKIIPGSLALEPEVVRRSFEGWLELKFRREWPKRTNTVMDLEISKEQHVWAAQRRAAGGRNHFLIRVEQDTFLLRTLIDYPTTRENIVRNALYFGQRGNVLWEEVARAMEL